MGLLTFTVVLLWWGSTLVQSRQPELMDCTRQIQGGLYGLNYDYYPPYYANWGRDEVQMLRRRTTLWKFEPVNSKEPYVYIRSNVHKDYIFDAASGFTQQARLHRSTRTKFKIMCKRHIPGLKEDVDCKYRRNCQIRTDEGRKLYTSSWMNTKFCRDCGSEDWFHWSLEDADADGSPPEWHFPHFPLLW